MKNIIYQNKDFFEAYPDLEFKLPFRKIKEVFPEKASLYSWYIFLYCDTNSSFRTYPAEHRRIELSENFIKEDIHDFPEIQEAIKDYEINMMSLAKRNFKKWEDKLTERQKFIEDTDYTSETFEMLDKLMAQTSKMWDMFLKLKTEFDKEGDEDQTYGGVELSASEKGMI